ncbi:MAG TPA: hypothetical protein DCS07_05505 [Bdellovibrionales bacterium]|nr:MAG: hypothetical protein A2X97_12910 [Bdellovibrionales bacterium GWA1_52_35]OFZ39658.1 MAG: hypothetical protein A2070_02065 [Bdellovibrionales bacterium GWC1_52_8]HAR42075.1 hypothetical protein [Bdellovibrionales bacterium]HCM39924.1 hypothetical protein [Bdellovibrionales bacterium]
MSEFKIIETRTGKSFLCQDGILQVDIFPGAECLVQLGAIKSMDRDTRVYLGGENAAMNVGATAWLKGFLQ